MAEKDKEDTLRIYVMGRPYDVTKGLTIQSALEEAGFLLIRGSGCRGGFCGGCTTVYRMEDDYKLHSDLACQKTVEEGMHLVQLPYTPAPRPDYNIMDEKDEDLDATYETVIKHYPEVARCVSCNRCTDACPQDLDVMGFINDILKGDIEGAARESFDCIQCGICALRCPADIPQYNVAQLVRRLQGKYGESRYDFLQKRINEINEGKYEEELEDLKGKSEKELEEKYEAREIKA